MTNQPVLSFAGSWRYANHQGADIVTFYDQIKLGTAGLNGLVLGGWSYGGWDNTTFRTTNIAILDQSPDGTLKLNTSQYVQDPTVNGAGSVIVYDFNADGREDVFLAAHNESPFVSKNSTVLMALPDGNFQKVVLNDTTQAHAAALGELQGKATVVTAGYGDVDAYFQFDPISQQFNVLQWGNDASSPEGNTKSFYGSVAIAGDFDNDGSSELIIGDDRASPGVDFQNNGPAYFAVYELDGNRLADAPSFKTTLYFDNNPIYRSLAPGLGALTHNYRLWSDDFNHDGLDDVVAGVSVWANSAFLASKLELMQNSGNLQFVDKTDQLASAYSEKSNNVDYSMQLLDIDHSGIASYLLAEAFTDSVDDNCNYLLLNDGTGKLYTALHEEFMTWGASVRHYLDSLGAAYNSAFVAPKFIAYQNDAGAINYLAQWVSANDAIPLVNVPVQYNVTTDFTQDVTVSDRNNSMLIRTWAGDDTFYDTHANTIASIDGGFGLDLGIYSGRVSQYDLTGLVDGRFVVDKKSSQGASLEDTLSNIERLRFSDAAVALDIAKGEVAGSAYRLYKAAFDRIPEAQGLGFWINALDHGANLVDVAQGFINSDEFRVMYGANPTDQQFVTLLYNHVLHRTPEGEGYQFWLNSLSAGVSRAQVLKDFSESAENIGQTAGLIANGIQYETWVG